MNNKLFVLIIEASYQYGKTISSKNGIKYQYSFLCSATAASRLGYQHPNHLCKKTILI